MIKIDTAAIHAAFDSGVADVANGTYIPGARYNAALAAKKALDKKEAAVKKAKKVAKKLAKNIQKVNRVAKAESKKVEGAVAGALSQEQLQAVIDTIIANVVSATSLESEVSATATNVVAETAPAVSIEPTIARTVVDGNLTTEVVIEATKPLVGEVMAPDLTPAELGRVMMADAFKNAKKGKNNPKGIQPLSQ